MIQSETELYSNKTDFQSVQTNTITMLCLRPNLLYGLTLPMLRKLVSKLDTTNLEYTPEYSSNLADSIKSSIDNVLNFEEIQVKKVVSGKIFSELTKIPNTINITERLSLIDGVELLNIQAALSPDQYSSIPVTNIPMLVRQEQQLLVNNNYIKLPVKNVYIDLTSDLNTFSQVQVCLYGLNGSPTNTELTFHKNNSNMAIRNFVYNDGIITLANNNLDTDYVGVIVRNSQEDPLKYSFFYTIAELAQKLGGKPTSTIQQSNVLFSGNTYIQELPTGYFTLIFERDAIVVNNNNIVVSTRLITDLVGKRFNLVRQSLSITTKSQNVNDIFGVKQVKYKSIILPGLFIQAGDYLSDIEIVTTNKNEAILFEPIYPGNRTVTLGTYKRWKQLCNDLNNIIYVHKTLDDYKNMNPDVLRSNTNRLQIIANQLISLFKSYSFGRLQSFVIKGLNALSDAHRANNYDVALDDLFGGDLVSYINRTEDDCNSNRYLVNVIRKAIYDLVTT